MIRILYLSYNSVLTSGILQSQVLTPLQLLSQKYSNELSFTLISAERWHDYTNQQLKNSYRQTWGGSNNPFKTIFIPKFLPPQLSSKDDSMNPIKKLFFRILLLLDICIFTITTLWIVYIHKINILHARSYIPGMIGLFIKKYKSVKLVFDPRGLIPEELQLTKGWTDNDKSYKKWKKMEFDLLLNSDVIIVLSKPFAEHYQQYIPKINPMIIPCCVDTNHFTYNPDHRMALRTKNLFTEKFIVLYTMGHYVPYQDFDTAILLFKQIQQNISNSFFLVLTPDQQLVSKKLIDSGITTEQFTVLSISFQNIPEQIMMCDVGLLVRIPAIFSKVSSPVKFAEYLSCGLPVLSSPEIGDTDEIIKLEKIGRILNHQNTLTMEDINWLKTLQNLSIRHEIALRCHQTALHYYSWNKFLKKYLNIYQNLSPNNN